MNTTPLEQFEIIDLQYDAIERIDGRTYHKVTIEYEVGIELKYKFMNAYVFLDQLSYLIYPEMPTLKENILKSLISRYIKNAIDFKDGSIVGNDIGELTAIYADPLNKLLSGLLMPSFEPSLN